MSKMNDALLRLCELTEEIGFNDAFNTVAADFDLTLDEIEELEDMYHGTDGEDFDDDFSTDFDDAEVLASAGFGTDEDYNNWE